MPVSFELRRSLASRLSPALLAWTITFGCFTLLELAIEPQVSRWEMLEHVLYWLAGAGLIAWLQIRQHRTLAQLHQAMETLSASERRWQAAVDSAGDGLWDWNIETGEVFFSPQLWGMLGYAPGEVDGHVSSWEGRVHPDDLPRVRAELQACLAGRSQSYSCEHRVCARDGSYRWVLDRGQIVERTADGRPRRMIGTHTEVTARRIAEEQLRESRDRYRFILERGSNAIVAFRLLPSGLPGRFLEVSAAACRLGGYTREELLQLSPQELEVEITAEEAQLRGQLLRTEGKFVIQTEVRARDGRRIPVEIVSEVFPLDGQPTVLSSLRDITESRRQEERQRKDVEQASLLLDLYGRSAGMSEKEIYDHIIEVATRLTDSPIGFLHRVGEDQESILLTTWNQGALQFCTATFDNHYPISRAGNWVDCVRERRPIIYNDFAHSPHQKGLPPGHNPVRRFMSMPVIEGGKVRIIFGVGNKPADYGDEDLQRLQLIAAELQKILGRRRTEAELAEREAGFRELFSGNPNPMWVIDRETLGFLAVNDAALRLYGYDRDEFLRMTTLDIRPPEERERLRQSLAAGNRGYTFDGVWRHWRKNGEELLVEVSSHGLTWAGREARSVLVMDVTGRQRAEQALRASEQRYRLLVDTTAYPVVVNSVETGCVLFANQRALEFFEYAGDSGVGARAADFWVDAADRDRWYDTLKREKRVYGQEVALRTARGRQVWVEMSGSLIEYEGQAAHFATLVDITERKRAVELVQKNEHDLSLAMDLAKAGSWEFDAATGNLTFNDRLYRLYSTSAEQEGGYVMPAAVYAREFLLPEDQPIIAEELRKVHTCTDPKAQWRLEHRIRRRDGAIRHLLVSIMVRTDDRGRIVGSRGVNQDITELRELVSTLQERERELELFFNQSLDGFFFMMLDEPVVWNDTVDKTAALEYAFTHQRITRTNDALLAQYGATREWMLGRTPADLMAHDPETGREVWRQFFDQGRMHVETDERRVDGSQVWIEGDYICLYDGQGRITGHFGVQRDVTERKRAEAELLRSQAYLARTMEFGLMAGWEFDLASGALVLNDQFYTLHGTSVAREGGYTLPLETYAREFLPPEEVIRLAAQLRHFQAESRPGAEFQIECRMRRRDGSIRRMHVRVTVISDAAGAVAGTRGVIADITALRQAQDDFRQLFEQMNEGFALHEIICESDGTPVDYRFLAVNPAFERLTGLKAAAVVGRTVREILPATEQRWIEIYGRVACTGEAVAFSEYTASLDRYFDVSAFRPAPGQFACLFTDVTARRKSEQEIRKLARALEQSPVTVVITNAHGEIEYANPQFTRATGYTLEEARGQNPRVLKSGVQSDSVYRELWQAISSGREWRGELCNRRKDGSTFWEDASISPVFDESGAITHYLAVKEDITERRAALEQIREQAALLAVTRDAIVLIDLEGRVRFWNRGAEELYGWPASEVAGRVLFELVYDAGHPAPAAARAAILDQGEWSGELRQRTRQGVTLLTQARGVLLRDDQGGPRAILLTATDITEAKRTEALLHRTQRLDSVGSLASGVAHDLNNVLSPIMMSVELLRPLAVTPADREVLRLLSDSARRGADVVRQLLIFSRGSDAPSGILELGTLLKEILRMIRETFPRNLELQGKVPRDLWPVLGHATQVYQVLLNLAVNARDAMPEGGRLVIEARNQELDEAFVRAHPEARIGRFVEVLVADTGCGIPAEIIDRIFDPFFTTKELGKGSGLGLSTVVGILKSHRGFVIVRSAVGQGTEFRVFLPYAEAPGRGGGAAAATTLVRGRGEKILLVDDEASIRHVLGRALAESGYEVLVASNGDEALRLARAHPRELRAVVLDMMMPGIDGLQVVRQLREFLPQLPILACSGLDRYREDLASLHLPGIRFLRKPFTVDVILENLRAGLDGPPSDGAGSAS